MAEIPFNRDFDASPGEPDPVSPLVTRVLAPNASPFTFKGTCSYVIGTRSVAIVDPGPADPAHIAAIERAIGGRQVAHILVTHTHRDHSPGARLLKERTGGTIIASGPHRTRPVSGAMTALDAAGDLDFAPDQTVVHAECIEGDGYTFECVFTPGHTANHMAFSLREERALFSGDHVMAWSTSVVAPPDGDMGAYMTSLNLLRERDDRLYWPGHGGPVANPTAFVRAFITHRRMREAAILKRLERGDTTIAEVVAAIYENLPAGLAAAAGLSVFAHLVDLALRGAVACDDAEPQIGSRYRLA